MKNVTKHSRNLNSLLKDTRLNPSRRLLAEMLLMVIDNRGNEFGERILKLTEGTFGSAKRITYNDNKDQPAAVEGSSKIENEAKDNLRNILGSLLGE